MTPGIAGYEGAMNNCHSRTTYRNSFGLGFVAGIR